MVVYMCLFVSWFFLQLPPMRLQYSTHPQENCNEQPLSRMTQMQSSHWLDIEKSHSGVTDLSLPLGNKFWTRPFLFRALAPKYPQFEGKLTYLFLFSFLFVNFKLVSILKTWVGERWGITITRCRPQGLCQLLIIRSSKGVTMHNDCSAS
jgi:hypothetical protein